MGAETYTGVVILRRTGSPVDKASFPTDKVDPALCSTLGTGVVVFNDSTGKTSFTDNATNDTCGAPANGTTYFYKVFLRDSSNYYSYQPITNGSTYTEEISATPAATVAAQQNTKWIAATFATDLASPSLIPGSVAAMGSQTNLLFFMNAVTGMRQFVPISLGGSIASRSPLIDAASSSTGQDIDYVTDQDGLIYAVNTDTGVIDWAVNPDNKRRIVALQGGPAVQLKSIAGGTNDQVFFGTRTRSNDDWKSDLWVERQHRRELHPGRPSPGQSAPRTTAYKTWTSSIRHRSLIMFTTPFGLPAVAHVLHYSPAYGRLIQVQEPCRQLQILATSTPRRP